MIKVLHILGKESAGGAEIMALNFQKGFSKNIHAEYLVFCPKTNTLVNKHAMHDNIKLHLFPDFKILNYIQIYIKLKELFHNVNYDIIHLHSPVLGFICLKAAKKTGVRARIIHYHSSAKSEHTSKLLRNAILYHAGASYATHFIACSKKASIAAPRNANIKIIYNGIDCEKYKYNHTSRIAIRKKLGYENKIIIGHVGRLSFPKNQTFLLDIFEEIFHIQNNCILFIIGDGPLQKHLKTYIKGKSYEKNVIFWGNSNHIPELLSIMDVFVMTSFYEGLPLSVLEAQSSGLPCILSSHITKEVSVLNSNCFIGLKKDKAIWANVILKKVMMNEINRNHSYLDMIEKGFDITHSSGTLEEYYKEIIGG